MVKVTVEGKELWTVPDIIDNTELSSKEVFKIEVGELRKLHQRHLNTLRELHQAKLELELLKSQNVDRFIVYA